MTIAHIGPAALPVLYPLGGAIQRRIREIARIQAQRSHRVIVCSPEKSDGSADVSGFELRKIRCRTSLPLRTVEFAARACASVRGDRPDIIHFHSLPEGSFVAESSRGGRVLSFDYFRFRRGKWSPLFPLYRCALGRFDCLLPVSSYCCRESLRYWSIRPSRCRVLYNGVNGEQFCPDPTARAAYRQRLGLGDDPVILYVGRVCRQKGSDILIQAVDRARKTCPQLRLVVAGPAEQFGRQGETSLVEAIRRVGGTYLGAVPEEQLPAVYNLADIFIMPTREDEMFGMAAVEAQACGKPVIFSDTGGLPEAVSDQSGVSFPPGDTAALASRIERLVQDKSFRESLAAEARRSSSRFEWSTIVDQLDKIYYEVAGSGAH